MRKQLAYAYVSPRWWKIIQVTRGRRVQIQLPLLGQLRGSHAGERLGGRIERKAGVARGEHTVLDIGQAVGLGQHDLPVLDHRNLQSRDALLQHDLLDQPAGLVVGLILAGRDGGEGQGADEHEHDSKRWAEHAGFRRGVEDRMQRERKRFKQYLRCEAGTGSARGARLLRLAGPGRRPSEMPLERGAEAAGMGVPGQAGRHVH